MSPGSSEEEIGFIEARFRVVEIRQGIFSQKSQFVVIEEKSLGRFHSDDCEKMCYLKVSPEALRADAKEVK